MFSSEKATFQAKYRSVACFFDEKPFSRNMQLWADLEGAREASQTAWSQTGNIDYPGMAPGRPGRRLLARKPSKNHGKIDISKNERKKIRVFLHLLRPEKSASRLGEKQILTNLGKKKVSFPENCNFRKWSSRVGESPILNKKTHKLQKSSELRRGRFLRDVSANIAILTKNDNKKQQFLVPFLEPKMAQNAIKFLTIFGPVTVGPVPDARGWFLMDVSCEITILD